MGSDNQRRMKFRKRIYEIIEVSEGGDNLSLFYDIIMLISIVISLIPLGFKEKELSNDVNRLFNIMDISTVSIFIIDYILRFITADYKFNDRSINSFIKYPFTIWGLIDLISILPSLISFVYDELKLLRIIKMIKTFKIVRVFKTFRYSRSISIITDVIKNSKHPLIAVGTLAVGYILTSALIIFNVEETSFNSFFDAIYWATVSLTTVGYGDIYPVTTAGRIITMVSSLFGIALVALPAGIITAGYLDSLNEINERRKERRLLLQETSVTLCSGEASTNNEFTDRNNYSSGDVTEIRI